MMIYIQQQKVKLDIILYYINITFSVIVLTNNINYFIIWYDMHAFFNLMFNNDYFRLL